MSEEIKEESVSDGYEKQEGAGIWLPESEGDTLAGEVTAIETEGLYGKQVVIKKADGEETKTPSHKVLQARIGKVAVGDMVKIVYLNEEPPSVRGNNPTKMYDVYIKKKE